MKKRDNAPAAAVATCEETIEKLLAVREPFYAEADITLEYAPMSPMRAVDRIMAELAGMGYANP